MRCELGIPDPSRRGAGARGLVLLSSGDPLFTGTVRVVAADMSWTRRSEPEKPSLAHPFTLLETTPSLPTLSRREAGELHPDKD